MYIYIQKANAVPQDALDGGLMRAYRRANRITIRKMATRLGLYNRSSLLQYECGSKPLSKAVVREFARLTKIWSVRGSLFTSLPLPAKGAVEINIAISGEIKQCSCGIWFVAGNRMKEHHSRDCQLHDWRRRRKAGKAASASVKEALDNKI